MLIAGALHLAQHCPCGGPVQVFHDEEYFILAHVVGVFVHCVEVVAVLCEVEGRLDGRFVEADNPVSDGEDC